MNLQVMILLGLNCNFKCNHCINESRPGFKEFDIPEDEINHLVNDIKSNEHITNVAFSGGEPLLYLDRIEKIVSSLRAQERKIQFSMTTNGSLISKFKEQIKAIGIGGALISYDKAHSDFQDTKSLEENLIAAKEIFSELELTATYEKSPAENILFDIALRHQLKVRFNQVIRGGRQGQSCATQSKSEYGNIECPSLFLAENRVKLTYTPKVGFSICCGPLLFDNLKGTSGISFPTIKQLLESNHFQLLKSLAKNRFLNSSKNPCENCSQLLSNQIFKKYSHFLLKESSWQNLVPYATTTEEERNFLDQQFRLTLMAIGDKKAFEKDVESYILPATLMEKVSSNLSEDEINEFVAFTIHSFYSFHGDRFSQSDIDLFKSQIPMFFKLNYKVVMHKKDGNLVSFLIIGLLLQHPLNNNESWHVGYWGMDQSLDRDERRAIRTSWHKVLKDASKKAPVIAVVDYFNKSAFRLAENFGMDLSTLRIEGRKI